MLTGLVGDLTFTSCARELIDSPGVCSYTCACVAPSTPAPWNVESTQGLVNCSFWKVLPVCCGGRKWKTVLLWTWRVFSAVSRARAFARSRALPVPMCPGLRLQEGSPQMAVSEECL